MAREIKAAVVPALISKSFDGQHEIQFNDASHRYKWMCPCHAKAPAVSVTTFIKAGYPTNMALISWMKGQTAEALFKALTVPGEDGFYPREAFWPVTQKVKSDLIARAKLADRDTAQEAADIGTILHGFGELHSLGKKDEAEALLAKVRGVSQWPLIEKCVGKYLEWDAAKHGTLIAAESLVASPTHLFCGKLDRLDQVDGRVILRDYKTSKAIFTEQKIQLATYALAIQEWLGLHVDGIEIIRFGKLDGEFETELVDDPKVLAELTQQAIRCRETYTFINEFEKRGSK